MLKGIREQNGLEKHVLVRIKMCCPILTRRYEALWKKPFTSHVNQDYGVLPDIYNRKQKLNSPAKKMTFSSFLYFYLFPLYFFFLMPLSIFEICDYLWNVYACLRLQSLPKCFFGYSSESSTQRPLFPPPVPMWNVVSKQVTIPRNHPNHN